MTQPYLTLRYQSSSHAQGAVFQEVNGLLTQVGSDFGLVERGAPAGATPLAYNKVVNWNGSLWATLRGNIYKYDIANSGDWGIFHTPTTAISTPFQSLGLVAGTVDDVGVLVTAHQTTTDDAIYTTIYEDETVVEGVAKALTPGGLFTSRSQFGNPIWHNGQVHWAGIEDNYGPVIAHYNPSSDSVTYNLVQPRSFFRYFEGRSQLGTHNGRIYSAYTYRPTSELHLVRVDGSSMEVIAVLNTNFWNSNPNSTHQGNAIASIDGKIIVVAVGSVGSQTNPAEYHAYEIEMDDADELVGFTDITSATKPAAFATSIAQEQTQFAFRLDNVSDILGVGSIWEIEHGTVGEAESVDIYEWRGIAKSLSLVGGGKNSYQHSRVSIPHGTGGERIFAGSGTLSCSTPAFTVNGSDIDIGFKVYGNNITNVALGIVYDKEGESCEALGTVIATSVGTIEGIYASGITATMAGTPVTVKWSAAADGISTGDFPKVAGRVFK